jgi:hypothetical protein
LANEITRRTLLAGLGAGAGLAVAGGLGVRPLRGEVEPSFSGVLRDLARSLTPGQRERIVLPADHPSRQIVNTLAVLDRPHLGTLLSQRQVALVRQLVGQMLSSEGRADFAATFTFEGRFEGCVLAIYGEPESGRAQVVISGGHLLLRGGAPPAGAAAFGGAVAWGQQIGNERWRVEGNAFAKHSDAANRFFATLSLDERRRAVLPAPPSELLVQAQGLAGTFPGVKLGSLSDASFEAADSLLDTVFATYPLGERAEVRSCIDDMGGLKSLHFATYETKGFYEDMRSWAELAPPERARRGDPYWQVWRLEGPGSVIHFKGHPHVHAYANVVRDPARAQVGETLGNIAAPLGDEAMRRLLEAAFRSASGEELAWHDVNVPGRFCTGPVTTGLAYAMDPYGNRVAVATIEGRAMATPLRERLAAGGTEILPDRRYRIATNGFFPRLRDRFGQPEDVAVSDLLVRDALVAHLRAGGLDGLA